MYFSKGYSAPLPFDLGWMRTVWLQSCDASSSGKTVTLKFNSLLISVTEGSSVMPSGANNLKFNWASCKSERLRVKRGLKLQVNKWKKRCAVPMRIGILACLHHFATILFGNKWMTTSNLQSTPSRSCCEDCSSSSRIRIWSIGSKQATTAWVYPLHK